MILRCQVRACLRISSSPRDCNSLNRWGDEKKSILSLAAYALNAQMEPIIAKPQHPSSLSTLPRTVMPGVVKLLLSKQSMHGRSTCRRCGRTADGLRLRGRGARNAPYACLHFVLALDVSQYADTSLASHKESNSYR